MDENFTKDIEQEKNDNTISNSTTDNVESPKDEKSNTLLGFFFILIVGFIIWFLFFRIPTKVTTEMIEADDFVESVAETEIVQQIEDSYLISYMEYAFDYDIEECIVDVSIPDLVKSNPENYQTGDRYEVDDGYAFPVKLPLKLNITFQLSDGVDESDPIDIDVSGSIVYLTGERKGRAFTDIEIEYEEDFMDLLDLADTYSSFAEFIE